MKNIVLTRIDDRLMHGQVVVSWIPYLKANEVIIIDDEYANDDFMNLLIKNAAPDNVKVNVFSVEKAADYLNENDEGSRILILLKNVGNLGSSLSRKRYYNSVHLSDDELCLLKEIASIIEVEIKMLPNDKTLMLE